MEKAQERMGKDDGGLARHSQECEIDCENTRVKGKERSWRQGKVRKGRESLRAICDGKKAQNSVESVVTWRLVLEQYFTK